MFALKPNRRNSVKILAFKGPLEAHKSCCLNYGTFTKPLRMA